LGLEQLGKNKSRIIKKNISGNAINKKIEKIAKIAAEKKK
jgi:hypothetical protein